jgi:Inner membrane component of T3SS, cytoplasmic domain
VTQLALPALSGHVPAVMLRQCFAGVLSGLLDVPHLALPFAAFAWVAGALVVAAGIQGAVDNVIGLASGAYQRAPVLVLVLSALVILPLVALISFAAQAGRRHRSREAAQRRAQSGSLAKEASADTPAWTLQAWLTIEGRSSDTMPLAGDVIRIGRHEGNDIRLTDRSVHRHHAVIERLSEESFVITDVSGKDGNGVRVNGVRTERAQLADGDLIELGRAKLRFETAPL